MSTYDIIVKSLFNHGGFDFLGFPTNYNKNLYGTVSIKEYNELIEFINSNSRRFDNGISQSRHKQYIMQGIKSSIEQINRNYSDRNFKIELCPSNTEIRCIYITLFLPSNQIQPMPLNNININQQSEREIILVPPSIENKIINYSQTQVSSFDPKDTNLKAVICYTYKKQDYTNYFGRDRDRFITIYTVHHYPHSLYNYLTAEEYSDILRGFNECERDVLGEGFFMILIGLILIAFVVGIFLVIYGCVKQKTSKKKNILKHDESMRSYMKFINSKYESRGITFGFHRVKKNEFEAYLIAYIPKDSKELPILTAFDDPTVDKIIVCTSKTGTFEPKYITSNMVNNIIDNSQKIYVPPQQQPTQQQQQQQYFAPPQQQSQQVYPPQQQFVYPPQQYVYPPPQQQGYPQQQYIYQPQPQPQQQQQQQ